MLVRSATNAGCPAITSAYLTSWRARYRDLLTEAQTELRRGQDWQAAIALSDRVVFDEEIDGHIIGVAECEHQPEQWRLPRHQML
jgi:hypothetical protein